MSVAPAPVHDRLQLPESLRTQLAGFRRQVWGVKTAEAACLAVFGVLVAFLLMFGIDRTWETPGWARALLFAGAALACAYAPVALHRWVWKRRRPDQLARLIARSQPRFGDQLLGVIELVRNDLELTRSRALCEAAVAQVADEAAARDFAEAVPTPRHRLCLGLIVPPLIAVIVLGGLYPAAAGNAWARLLAPWKSIPRYTFAAVAPLPDSLIVPHGEPFVVKATIAQDSLWKPARGLLRLNDRDVVVAQLKDGAYTFEIAPRIEPLRVSLKIGDARQSVLIVPTLRPELTTLVADLTLPAYLGRPKAERKDVRGGTIAVVKGSEARFAATASRDLASAAIDGRSQIPSGATVVSAATRVEGARTVEFAWRDHFGLSGKEPFRLQVNGRDDEAPSLFCEDLPRQKVVLDTEQIVFKVRASDHFGVKRVGMEWVGIDKQAVKDLARGERVLGAGATDQDTLDLAGSFSASALGIEPQPIAVRVYVEDYLPGRPRVYSPTSTLYVLNAEQHAIWLTEQLSKWRKQSLEVRDRELQLHATNKDLRELSAADLDRPENRRRIEKQADAERANGRRLNGLVAGGEDLVRQAMRNPEFGVGHLEKWAEMLQILKEIAAHRMPSVADLLKQAAQAPTVAMNTPSNLGPTAGKVRSEAGGKAGKTADSPSKPPAKVPQIVDQESTQQPPSDKPAKEQDDSPSKPKTPRLLLPQTTLAGTAKDAPKAPETPAQKTVDEAIKAQQDLLAEFDKIADELNKVLANLEGSTLMKRLKAAARQQDKVAGRIGDQVSDAFGVEAPRLPSPPLAVFGDLAAQEGQQSQAVSVIMDDLQSYFERRQFVRFKNVLDDMKKADVVGGLRQVGDDLKKENGLSIAQCEFWSDSLDRWAEDLVDPTRSGKCPGSKSKASLPPSLILEVLRILEGEINLREETRVAEQSRPALAVPAYFKQAGGLSKTQGTLDRRVNDVIGKIRELPDAEAEFGRELALLSEVSGVMKDAVTILDRPDTGRAAIAAETDVIELLLKSKRINPKGGGGGGSSPGGGGTGTTNDSALALVGNGLNAKEGREDHGVSQATGESVPSLPEEFRAGLDEYFNRLERRPATP